MFKRLSAIIFFTIFLGVSLVVGGVYIINSANWDRYEETFIKEKSAVISHFLETQKIEMINGVTANAYWTEALPELNDGNDEWLAVNATTYVTDLGLFKTDYILAMNEAGDFIQESGDYEMADEILDLSIAKKALTQNVLDASFVKLSVGYAIVVASPWTDNEILNPTGLYVAVNILGEEDFSALTQILGDDAVKYMAFTDQISPKPNEQVKRYETIQTHVPVLSSGYYLESILSVNDLYKLFSVQRNHIMTIVVLSATTVYLLIIAFIRVITNKIQRVKSLIQSLEEENYQVEIDEKGNWLFEDVNDMVASANRMSRDLKAHQEMIDNNYIEMTDVIVKAVEINDSYTSHHNIAVGEYAKVIAQALKYTNLKDIELAAKLHDIGKISIPGTILNKPGRLTVEEFEIIKTHPSEGYRIIQNIDYFKDISMGVRSHHEKWNGTGYPDGLKGDEIPLIAQIISIADVYDAVTSDRAYRKGMSHQEAMKLILENSGIMFNPFLVRVLLENTTTFENILKKRRREV